MQYEQRFLLMDRQKKTKYFKNRHRIEQNYFASDLHRKKYRKNLVHGFLIDNVRRF